MKRAFSQGRRLLFALPVLWPTAAWAQSATVSFGEGSLSGRAIQLIMLMTVLSLAPGILMTITSFTRIVVALSLLRTGIGAPGVPPNPVIISLAMFLSFFVMAPVFEVAWDQGVQPYTAGKIDETAAFEKISSPFRGFMLQHVRKDDLNLFIELSNERRPVVNSLSQPIAARATPTAPAAAGQEQTQAQGGPSVTQIPLSTLVPAFMISELRRAFEIGFMLLLPFLVIDLAVSAILMAMGMMMLPPTTIALPMKLIFFVLVDGWALVAGSLVRSFGT